MVVVLIIFVLFRHSTGQISLFPGVYMQRQTGILL